MPAISDELKAFVEAGAVASVGTRSGDLVPNGLRGWGTRVSADKTAVEIFDDRPAAATCISNLRDNGRIAVCFTEVSTNRSVQLKGRCVEVGDPQAADWTAVDAHREAFTREVGLLGFPAQVVRNMWSTQVVKIRFVVEDIYDQTPGPKAGRPL
jgi:hypothetical protein